MRTTVVTPHLEPRGQLGPDLLAIWFEYRLTHSRDARERLILCYEPLVRSVAGHLPVAVRSHWELSDLVSNGMLGLIDAIDRFAPESPPDAFAAYAIARIRGAIYDELRRLDWLPRAIRKHVICYRETIDHLVGELGRAPSTTEVLESMGVEPASAAKVLLDVQSSQFARLETPRPEGREREGHLERLVSDRDEEPEPRTIAAEQLAELRAAVAKLPERQRTVVSLHLLSGLTQDQTAAILGVSIARVSQIRKAAIESLRRALVGIPADWESGS